MERILMAALGNQAPPAPRPLLEAAPTVVLSVESPLPATPEKTAPTVPATPAAPKAAAQPDVQLHNWLEQQLGSLEAEQKTLWSRLVGKLNGQ
jgi:hypothetical protein